MLGALFFWQGYFFQHCLIQLSECWNLKTGKKIHSRLNSINFRCEFDEGKKKMLKKLSLEMFIVWISRMKSRLKTFHVSQQFLFNKAVFTFHTNTCFTETWYSFGKNILGCYVNAFARRNKSLLRFSWYVINAIRSDI